MNVTNIETGDLTATLKIEIAESDYAQKLQNELKKLAREASIPGFRPGKVPVGMIKKRFGTSVLLDVINKTLSETINDFVKDSKKHIFGEPLTSEDQKPVDFETQKDFEFIFDIAYLPEIDIELTGDMTLDYHQIKPKKELINQFIYDKRVELGEYKEVEAVENGDRIGFDISALDETGNEVKDSEPKYAQFQIADIHDKDVRDSLLGAKVDDVIKIDPLPFFGTIEKAAEVSGFEPELFENKTPGFQIRIINIERKHPAEMDKDFFGRVLPDKPFSSEQELREEVARLMENMYQADSDHILALDAIDYLMENSGIQLPDEFIKRWFKMTKENTITKEEIEKEYPAIRHHLLSDIIDAYLKNKYNELVVTGDDLKREMELRVLNQFNLTETSDENLDGIREFASTYAEKWLKDEKNKKEAQEQQKYLYYIRLARLLKEKITINTKEITDEEFKAYFLEKFSNSPSPVIAETPATEDVAQSEVVEEQADSSNPQDDEQ